VVIVIFALLVLVALSLIVGVVLSALAVDDSMRVWPVYVLLLVLALGKAFAIAILVLKVAP
jgi:hypothetical protein